MVQPSVLRPVTLPASARGVLDFVLLLPPGWARIPLDDRAPLRVKQLVDERTGGVAPEHRQTLRTAMSAELTSALRTAADGGGLDMLISLDPVRGMPVPASGLITCIRGEQAGGLDALVSALRSTEADTEVLDMGVVQIAGADAARRRSVRTHHVPSAGPDLGGGDLRIHQLDVAVPVPGTPDVLLLSFSTPIEPLADALVQLFDVIAASLRWVRA